MHHCDERIWNCMVLAIIKSKGKNSEGTCCKMSMTIDFQNDAKILIRNLVFCGLCFVSFCALGFCCCLSLSGLPWIFFFFISVAPTWLNKGEIIIIIIGFLLGRLLMTSQYQLWNNLKSKGILHQLYVVHNLHSSCKQPCNAWCATGHNAAILTVKQSRMKNTGSKTGLDTLWEYFKIKQTIKVYRLIRLKNSNYTAWWKLKLLWNTRLWQHVKLQNKTVNEIQNTKKEWYRCDSSSARVSTSLYIQINILTFFCNNNNNNNNNRFYLYVPFRSPKVTLHSF